MMNVTTRTPNVALAPTSEQKDPAPITAEQESEIAHMLHKMYGIVGAGPLKWEECQNDAARLKIVTNVVNALTYRRRFLRQQAFAKVRGELTTIFATYITTHRAEKEEYETLSPTLKAKLGAFPTEVKVPVKDLVSVFGEGAQEPGVAKILMSEMSYKLSDGRVKGPLCVILDAAMCDKIMASQK